MQQGVLQGVRQGFPQGLWPLGVLAGGQPRVRQGGLQVGPQVGQRQEALGRAQQGLLGERQGVSQMGLKEGAQEMQQGVPRAQALERPQEPPPGWGTSWSGSGRTCCPSRQPAGRAGRVQ